MVLFGGHAAGAPDLTGDGVPERLVTPSSFSRNRHSAVVIEDGVTHAPLRSIVLGEPDDAFGYSACWIADLDGDAKEDLAVTAPLAVSRHGIGRAHAISSATGAVVHTFEPAHTGQFGLLVEPVSDLNGDGVGDVGVWSRFVDLSGRIINIRWVFSGATGVVLSPLSEGAAASAVKSDVTLDLAVDAEDLLVTLDALDTTAAAPGFGGDVDGDQIVDLADLSTVADHVGEMLDDPPGPIAFAGWSCEDPTRRGGGGVVEMLVLPGVSASSPVCPGDGTGGGGGGGGPGRIPGPARIFPPWGDPGAIDDFPFDPFNDGPLCAPDLGRGSNYICLSTDVACEEMVLLSSRPDTHWQVTGATIVHPAMLGAGATAPSITIRVCETGIVTVTMSAGDGSCAWGRTRTFRVVRTDVDLDSDNTSIMAAPDRSPLEEAVENLGRDQDHPGKVIKVSNWDSDSDGVEDFLDGFNFFGNAWTDDNFSTHPTPKVVVSIEGPIDDTALVYILYDASDPAGLRGNFPDPIFGPMGTLRLWAKDTSLERDPRPLLEGGDFVAPGAYPVAFLRQRFGVYSTWTFHVEAVNAGLTSIAAFVDPDGDRTPSEGTTPPPGPADEAPMCPDAAQVTATRLTLEVRACATCAVEEMPAFVEARPRAAGEEDPPGASGPFPWETFNAYRLRVEDWREFGSTGIEIGEESLALVLRGGGLYSESPWFYFAPPGVSRTAWEGMVGISVPTGAWMNVRYNPETPIPHFEEFFKQKHVMQMNDAMRSAIVDAQVAFQALPRDAQGQLVPNDNGALGKLVHQHAMQRVTALNDPRWMTGVWVDPSTRQVLSIGAPPSVNQQGLVELDMVYMKKGKRLVVGTVANQADIVDAFEIKTAWRGNIETEQLRRYRTFLGRNPVKINIPKAQKMVNGVWAVADNPGIMKKMGTLAKAAGAAAPFLACAMAYGFNGEEEAFQDLDLAGDRFKAASQSTDRTTIQLAGLEVMEKLQAYLTLAIPHEGVGNIATYVFSIELIKRVW